MDSDINIIPQPTYYNICYGFHGDENVSPNFKKVVVEGDSFIVFYINPYLVKYYWKGLLIRNIMMLRFLAHS